MDAVTKQPQRGGFLVSRAELAAHCKFKGASGHGRIAPLTHRFEQLVGPPKNGDPRFGWRVSGAGRIARLKSAVAMLAHDLPAQIFHADLQTATAGRAFLNEVR